MMKAPPTIETCLFGPSGKPLHIKSFRSASKKKSMNFSTTTTSTSTCTRTQPSATIETPLKKGRDDSSDNDSEDTQLNQEAAAQDVDTSLEIPLTKSPSCEGGNMSPNAEGTCSTPPQTPLRATPPTRPIKQISHTVSEPSKPQVPIQTNDVNDESTPSSPPPAPHTINLQELRRLMSQGVPSTCTYRALSWRVLLKSLPLDSGQWQATVDRDRSLYRNLVEELFVLPSWAETVRDPDFDWEQYGWPEFCEGEGRALACVRSDEDWITLINTRNGTSKGRPLRENSQEESTVVPLNEGLGLASAEGVEVIQSTLLLKDQDAQSPGKVSTVATTGIYSPSKRVSRGMSPKAEPLVEIPLRVREQWRKSGRDPDSLLAGLGRVTSSSVKEKYLNVLHISNTSLKTTTVYPNSQRNPNSIDEDADSDVDDGVEKSGDLLSKASSSNGEIHPKWTALLENATLLDEIRKDVVRTHPDLQFFLNTKNNLGLRRYAALERILFVWAKLNKGVSDIYVISCKVMLSLITLTCSPLERFDMFKV